MSQTRPHPFDPKVPCPAWQYLADELERVRQWRDALRNRLSTIHGTQSILKEAEAEFCVVAWENQKMTTELRVKDRVGATHFSLCPACGEPMSTEERCCTCGACCCDH